MPKAPKSNAGKANKVIHPNSRTAKYLQRQANRDQRVQKTKADTVIKQEQLQQRLIWYQDNMDPQKSAYTKHEVAELTLEYLERFSEELEQIGIVNNIGNRQTKQHQARETAIKITQEKEKHEFKTVGIEVPDLINGKSFEYFRNWTGEINFLPQIKLRRSKDSDLKEATEESEASADDKISSDELPDYVD
ncbi:translation machinery-associated protein 16 [Mactra antiquata]